MPNYNWGKEIMTVIYKRIFDSLRSKMVSNILDNFDLYANLGKELVNADLPQRLCYESIEDRVASMANPTEMVGEIEITATARCLQRPVHVYIGERPTKFGTEFVTEPPITLKYTNQGEDVGHYEALVLTKNNMR
jgi:hypothetical protein